MKKNFVAITAALALAVSSGTAVLAASDDVTVEVNGETIDFTGDQAPVIVDGRTLVPFRAVFEKMGADVYWYDDIKTCEAEYGPITVSLTIGDNVMQIGDGTTVEVDVPAQIMNGRTMVPVRVLSEGIGATVDWNEETRTVSVNTPVKTDYFPETADSIVASDSYTSEATGVTITYDYPVITDEYTAANKLNSLILNDIIYVAQTTADNYTGDLTDANISYGLRNSAGLFEVNYIINNQELIYNATYALATGSKLDENYLSIIYGDSRGYKIFTYSPEKLDSDGHLIKAYAEYPQFEEDSDIISSLNTQLENSAKKAVDSYLENYSEAAETGGENSFSTYCDVEISDDNIATITTEYVEIINGEQNQSTDIINVNLTTGEVTDAAAPNEDE